MEQNLRVPGPTPLPAAVREAQAAAMVDHRGSEFAEMLRELTSGIGSLIATEGRVLLLTGSGTGALEASVVNTCSPGDRVLSVSIGAFGERYAQIAEAFGASVDRLSFEWGDAADPQRLAAHLADAAPYHAVLLTHNETSTGVANPLRELVEVVRGASGEPLTLVDGISALGAIPFEMDAWGVDLVTSASQKAWMGSPGIAIIALGERAWTARENARMPRFYWDLAEAASWAEKGQTPWTPAVSVLYGLRVGVRLLTEEAPEATWARHARIAAQAQAGLEALGMRLVAVPERRSATVTAAWLPDGLDWAPFNGAMRARGLVIAGGQGKWAGRILRMGHMGQVAPEEIAHALAVLGATLDELGLRTDPVTVAR